MLLIESFTENRVDIALFLFYSFKNVTTRNFKVSYIIIYYISAGQPLTQKILSFLFFSGHTVEDVRICMVAEKMVYSKTALL